VPLLVDAAHAPGMLHRPLSGLDPDFWVGNMHKWAFAPPGSALLRVTAAWRDKLVPLVISHAHLDGFPRNIEQQGTRDHTTWLAARAGLSLFDRFDEAKIQRHNAELAAYGQRVIGDALGVEPSGLPDPGAGVSMRVIPLPEGVGADVASADRLRRRIADELATEVAVNPWRGRGLLRVSAQIYNSPEEYDQLAARLPALLGQLD
jgi:isopenicillin-N epimerase